jgi:hypothetical protein
MPSSEEPTAAITARGKDGLLRGKVAKLLNVREVALNIGATHGVKEGMKFHVLNRNAGEIVDPDTNKVLGRLTLPKVELTVNFVAEDFSVAEVVGTRTRVGFGIPSFFYEQTTFNALTLKRGDHPGVEEIDPKDSIVQVGDPVVEIQPSKP